MTNKRIGKIYDGRWRVIRYEKPKYILQNIYNQEEMSIKDVTLKKIEEGETTISKVRLHHMRRQGKKLGFKW